VRRCLLALVLAGCGPLVLDEAQTVGPLPPVAHPADNPSSDARVELGRMLFFDPILSGDRDVACASCHQPGLAYADGRARAVGTGAAGLELARNTPTVLDTAFNGLGRFDGVLSPETAPMFWDARTVSLEAQAEGPILAEGEMRGGHFTEETIFPELLARLQRTEGYRWRFEAAFGSAGVDRRRIVLALAAFERTLVSGESSWDRFVAGDDAALDLPARRGLVAFFSVGCGSCHGGPMFSDYALHDLGIAEVDPATGMRPRIRTPSLRNVARTAPYMHDGSVATLAEAVDFYTGIDTSLDEDLALNAPLGGGSTNDVVRFLNALSDGTFDDTTPPAVPSGLPVGGAPR
jgi:cytochrome c peroxidase